VSRKNFLDNKFILVIYYQYFNCFIEPQSDRLPRKMQSVSFFIKRYAVSSAIVSNDHMLQWDQPTEDPQVKDKTTRYAVAWP